jgi:hypothetical protein
MVIYYSNQNNTIHVVGKQNTSPVKKIKFCNNLYQSKPILRKNQIWEILK